jgi:hypothetical protein
MEGHVGCMGREDLIEPQALRRKVMSAKQGRETHDDQRTGARRKTRNLATRIRLRARSTFRRR